FESRLPVYRTVLKSLPLVIANAARNPKLYVRDCDGQLASIHWGKWTLEPFGSGMQVTDGTLAPNQDYLECLKQHAPDKDHVSLTALSLAFNYGRIEAYASRQCYRSAIQAMCDINEHALNT